MKSGTFYYLVRKACERVGANPGAIAKKIGLPRGYMQGYRHSGGTPPAEDIERIAEAIGCEVEEITPGEKKKKERKKRDVPSLYVNQEVSVAEDYPELLRLECRANGDEIAAAWQDQVGYGLYGPCHLKIMRVVSVPEEWSDKYKASAHSGKLRPNVPIATALHDVMVQLDGWAWANEGCIVEAEVGARYAMIGEESGYEIVLEQERSEMREFDERNNLRTGHCDPTLCWNCKRCYPNNDGCVWAWTLKEMVPGWKAYRTYLKHEEGYNKIVKSFRVAECPQYVEDDPVETGGYQHFGIEY